MRSVVGARPLSIVVLGLISSLVTIAPVASQQPAAPIPVSRYAPPAAPRSPYAAPSGAAPSSTARTAAPQAIAAPSSASAPTIPRGTSPLRGTGGTNSSLPGFNTLRGAETAPGGPAMPPAATYPPGGGRPSSPYGPAAVPVGVAPAVGPVPGGYSMPAGGTAASNSRTTNQVRIGTASGVGNSQLQIRPAAPEALQAMPGGATVARPVGAPDESPLPGTPSHSFAPAPVVTGAPRRPTTSSVASPATAGAVMISDDGTLSDTPPAASPTVASAPVAAVPRTTPSIPPPGGSIAPDGTIAPDGALPPVGGITPTATLPPTVLPPPVGTPSSATPPAIVPLDAGPVAGGTAQPAGSPAAPVTLPAMPAALPTSPGSLTPNGLAPGNLAPGNLAPSGLAPSGLPSTAVSGVPQALPAQVASPGLTDGAAMPKLEPVDFNGVLLGESTLDEVLAAWGEPRNRTTQDGVIRLNYVIEPFSDVEVTFFNGRATAIVIDLGETFSADAVAKELGLEGMPTVAIDDSHGKPLGLVFPERGVAFRFTGDGHDRLVTQIGLDRIDPRPFVLRAERRLRTEDQGALNDADTALSLDANLGRAHYVRGQVLRAAGRRREAMAATETALKLEPKSAEYLLARGQLLADEGLFDAAMQDTEAAVQAAAAAPHLQARAWSMRGDFLAGGPERDYVQAIDAHTRAIRLAEPLLKDERVAVRRAAREVLVEAHLGTADDIAWGEWAQKETVVPKWLTRAEKLAADGVKNDGLPADLLPTVYHRALTAAVGTQGKVDPKPWAEKLLQHTDAALVECTDPMRRTRLQYDTGFGLYDALQAAHARGNVDEALRFGTAAVERIQPGRAGRDPSPIDGYRYGRLYFRVGSLYAVGRQDHATAVEWFERAAPLLERPLPEAAAADRGRQGETLVSMGISYWALGKRERAIELTTLGTRIMQASVEAGMLEGTAMVVAYGNLSTMHEQMGDPASGKRYAEMATRLEASGDTLRR